MNFINTAPTRAQPTIDWEVEQAVKESVSGKIAGVRKGGYIVVALSLAAATLAACGSSSTSAKAAPSTTTKHVSVSSAKHDLIALSNSYAGNSWRAEMVSDFKTEAQLAVKRGLIKGFGVVNANNTAAQQISQIQDMILKGYKAITIDAASPTALNGVIAKACAAGIKVVTFDSLATAPCAYKVVTRYVPYGTTQMKYVAQRLHGKGNILYIKGIAGTSVNASVTKGVKEIAAKYPDLHVVGNVHGNWTESISQSAVASILPTLPKISAVISQGGETYGAAEAFLADHKKLPLLLFGNRGVALHFWLDTLGPSYKTISESSMPGISGAALWVAVRLLEGKSVPKVTYVPLLRITNKTLKTWVKATPVSGVATVAIGQHVTDSFISATEAHKAPAWVELLPNGKEIAESKTVF